MQSGRLGRQLVWREEQAYRGAYDFYRVGIPLVMLLAVVGHLHAWYFSENDQGQITKEMKALLSYAIGAVASYILAFKFYKRCNAI